MFDEIVLKDCPEKFYLNCKNYETKCHNCKGNKTSKYLHYNPINKSIINHPSSIVQKTKAVSYSRQGKAKEQKLISELTIFKNNRGSGSINGDGDANITISNFGRLNTEIKCRFKETNNFLPTLQEFKESKNQNIKLIFIHLVIPKKTYFYLDYKIFTKMWFAILGAPTINQLHRLNCKSDEFISYSYIITRLKSEKPYSHLFKIVNDLDFKTSKFGILYYDESTIFLLKNKVGTYACMNEFTFKELIDLYEYTNTHILNENE